MKKISIIIAVCFTVLFTAGIVLAVSSGILVDRDHADEWVAAQETEKYAMLGKATPDPEENMTLYERSMLHADPEQKKKLEGIDTYGYEVLPEEMTKQIMIIMGELPEDVPMLTLVKAQELIEEVKADPECPTNLDLLGDTIAKRFNEIAGAPDIECGSGLSHRIYFLNEEHTECIDITMGLVYYSSPSEAEAVRIA